jgi:hypothetical protein
MEPSAKLPTVLLFCRRALYGERKKRMNTLNDFLREHPVTVIHLYRPDPKDWYKDVMAYLSRVNDWRRRVGMLKASAELLDSIEEPDEELSVYRDEVHLKLVDAEQDMKRVRAEITELIGWLDNEEQRTVFTRRYVEWQSWNKIAWAVDMPVETVKMLHAKALPKLKRLMVKQGLIPDTYVPKKHKQDIGADD